MPAMEVKGQLISAPDPLTCPGRKQRERMTELQDRRRSLQLLLSMRLTELKRICLKEAELTGAVPSDFPLEAGEKPPFVRRRGAAPRQGNRKCRAEEEDSQRSKPKKTLFSGALRKHSDSEQHNTHTHGKRTVHRGCHTDDTVKSESSSTSDSTGHDKEDSVSQCRPPPVSAASPVEVFYHNKTRRNSLHNRNDQPETPQRHKPLPLPPVHPPFLSQDSSSSGPSDPETAGEGGVRVNTARRSSSSDGLLDRVTPSEEEGGPQQEGLWVNGLPGSRGTNAAGVFRSSEMMMDGRTRINNRTAEGGGRGGEGGGGRGGGYSEVLLDYVWGKQQQLQRQQSQTNNRQPITLQHQLLYNGQSSQQPPGAPPTFRGHHGEQRQVKVTRTKSCGPFLPMQQSQSDTHKPSLSAIQPDPHPHLLPPRPPQLLANQEAQLEEATRSLHKSLALEGLRDWYLRNTLGSTHQNQANIQVSTGVSAKVNGGVKGQPCVGRALQRRRTTHGVIQQSTYHTEMSHHHTLSLHKLTLPHSATFHGQPLLGRSVDSSLYHDHIPLQKQEVSRRDSPMDQPSPGTLV
ncbi:coiled-coil domain-containing protein 120 [Scophthalmus maximus]|uniref:coiled-coil domain-containing protein 120 n=1 Tax=Scophthalmus maximus TaxID=52904 RepID=UPI0015E15233|nr:coiled-coil domain-containing protein 120 [Scophthalmus maximus]XP_035501116.1 coiled-coil domain-containing protein 120 [Scophthalmus maximus]